MVATGGSSGPSPSLTASSSSPPPSQPLPRPPPMLRAPAPAPVPRTPRPYIPPAQLPPGALVPPPPRMGPLVRPPPPRQGQPASHRNFDNSSAGGATSHLGYGATGAAGAAALESRRTGMGTGERGALSGQQARKRERWGDSYIPAEETIRNDYSGQYVQTGARPQNHLRNTAVETRFSEYPKLATLLAHKHALTASPKHSIPPTYLNLTDVDSAASSGAPAASPMSAALASLGPSRFDCILLTPPPSVTCAELAALDLGARAATPGFVWLWVGSGQTGGGIGLERGRELLSGWGYRRCEDIVWLKTNRSDPEGELLKEPVSLFNPTIEHCLMGIRGTVRRSTDSFLVHCNVDTDVIVWEGDPDDPDLKPPELQTLIENFCLGTRRLHLYGSPCALRRGWLTVSAADTSGRETYSAASAVRPVEGEGAEDEQRRRWGPPRAWSRDEWEARWRRPGGGPVAAGAEGAPTEVDKVESLLPFVEELDALRPKSPPPRNGLPSSGGLGRGRGAGLGITRSGLIAQGTLNGTPSSPNGLGRGRGRGRRDAPGPGPALLPPGAVRPPPPPPFGMSYPGAPPGPGLTPPHPTASSPPYLGAPPHFPPPQQQQQFYSPPPTYSPYTAHPSWPYQQPHPPHFSAPQVGTYQPPPPPAFYPHQHAQSHAFLPPPSAPPPPHADPLAVQAHLTHLQQEQHRLAAHLAALQLAAPAPVPVHVAGGEGQGLVYPIGGPREAWEDAAEGV